MTNKLTKDQEKSLHDYAKKAIEIGRSVKESPINKIDVGIALTNIYKRIKLPHPEFIYCSGPTTALKLIKDTLKSYVGNNIISYTREKVSEVIDEFILKKLDIDIWVTIYETLYSPTKTLIQENINDVILRDLKQKCAHSLLSEGSSTDNLLYGQFNTGWIMHSVFYLTNFLKDIKADIKNHVEDLYILAKNCSYIFPFKQHCFICEKPIQLNINAEGRLHKETGKAVEFGDGFTLHYLNGIKVSKEIAETHPNKLDPGLLFREQNADIQAQIVAKIGYTNLFDKLHGKELGSMKLGQAVDINFDVYTLLELKYRGQSIKALKMLNASEKIYCIEPVDQSCTTAEEAFYWRYPSLKNKNYEIIGIS